jgi:hypothetical protein
MIETKNKVQARFCVTCRWHVGVMQFVPGGAMIDACSHDLVKTTHADAVTGPPTFAACSLERGLPFETMGLGHVCGQSGKLWEPKLT